MSIHTIMSISCYLSIFMEWTYVIQITIDDYKCAWRDEI